ncbi:MAG: Asp-tRNA(Asn)/Glu-tRNA(Gln) amidotransferase subunit GatB [Candidatus Melainabacteria bacterium]|nr:Asp-tRNA(Asn)/Glu-tRNA(Gln) amidotransferase subunit GatB [Candidatus Melainabacteria bacterium]
MKYETVIGLEVHAQLKTKTKIFCRCPTEFGAAPNDQVCQICLGMPGVLPVLNKKAVEHAIKAGLALNCEISETTKFDRKNYFYPDLPKGYQISQYDAPVCMSGHLMIDGKKIRIHRAHLEEDAGKLVHAGAAGLHGSDYSLVDFNRSGVPLLEIVSEPDITSPEEAKNYLTELRNILRYIDVCDGNLEEGSFRCDANVSLRPVGQKELGTKAEIKNVNSFRAVQKAIQSEIERQSKILDDGGRVVQESRLWNEADGKTHSMRSKEEAHDYRYFPDPDLVPLSIESAWIAEIRATLPELPEEKRQRYVNSHGLSLDDAAVLAESKDLADFFDETLKLGANAKLAANLLIGPTTAYTNDNKIEFTETKLTAKNLADLIAAIDSGKLGSTNAKKLLLDLLATEGDVNKVIEEKGLAQLSNEDELRKMVEDVLAKSQAQVEQYRSGKTKIRQFFFGEVMKISKGKANPEVTNKILDELLPQPEST